jgi:hypothetical protein
MSNQTSGIPVNREADLAAFDALPGPLKRLVWAAPYKFSAQSVAKQLRKRGGDVVAARRDFIEYVFVMRDREIRKDYGEDHPMIGAR